jgi:DNA replication protein DnaC
MLRHPLYETLRTLKLEGMIKGLLDQEAMPDIEQVPFMDRLALLIDREFIERENKRITSRLREAKLRQSAAIEDLDFKTPRKLDRSLILKLSEGAWISQHQNVLITGPTGVGKSYLACALGQKACRMGYRVFYQRLTRLLAELEIARGDGRYPRLINSLSKIDVLILDDWGLEGGMTDRQRRDLLEVLDDRYASRSTLVTSQLPVDRWHDHIGDPTVADAILDRLIHNAHRIPLDGPSMRRKKGAAAPALSGHEAENTQGGAS